MRDPFANYDQWKTASPYDDEIEDNSAVETAFADYAGPYDLYRMVYKYTPCGPTIGFTFYGEYGQDNGESGPGSTYEPPHNRTFYCDDLRQCGTWKDLAENGMLVTEILVSSIVEGVDETTETLSVDCDGSTFEPEDIQDNFWKAVTEVDRQAENIWMETHGCPDCFEGAYPEHELHPVDEDCKSCEGSGIPI